MQRFFLTFNILLVRAEEIQYEAVCNFPYYREMTVGYGHEMRLSTEKYKRNNNI